MLLDIGLYLISQRLAFVMPTLLWLYGLPCSGKTTLAHAAADRLRQEGKTVVQLDGDELRRGLCSDLGFSRADREENLRRVAQVARLLGQQGVTVVASLVTPTVRDREIVRGIAGDALVSIFVDCPVEECARRDVKGHYARAARGDLKGFTGVDDLFERPPEGEPRVVTSGVAIADSLDEVLAVFGRTPDSQSKSSPRE